MRPAATRTSQADYPWSEVYCGADAASHLTLLNRVNELTLEDVEFPSPASLSALLYTFPDIENLTCTQIRVRHYTIGSTKSTRMWEGLQKAKTSDVHFRLWLHADNDSAKPLGAALRQSDVYDYVVSISVYIEITLRHLPTSSVGSLLRALHGRSMHRLRLIFDCRGVTMRTAAIAVGE